MAASLGDLSLVRREKETMRIHEMQLKMCGGCLVGQRPGLAGGQRI